jgi:hypothetical protein
VSSYADHWLETVARARLRPATWTNYSYAVRVHIGPRLGSVRLRSQTPTRVRRFLAERTRGWSGCELGADHPRDASNTVG